MNPCKSRNRANTEHFRWCSLPDHPIHQLYKDTSKEFARAIKKAKAEHWQDWIDHVSGEDIWAIHRYMKVNPTDYRCQWILALKKLDGSSASTNNQKAEQLANTFFLLERPLSQHKHQFTKNNPPMARHSKFPTFTPERIASMLTKVNPHKVPGPSGISNAILKHCAQLLAPHLAAIYTAICRFKHYLSKLHKIHQVVLPKPGQASYKIPSSYRPIALIETMAKVQSMIVAEELSYECKVHGLLPNYQFRGQPGQSTTDTLHYIEQFMRNA